MSEAGIEFTGPRCSPPSEMSAPSAISRIAVNAATVNDAINARKKFIAPVAVPTCERATAFWIETTLTGNAVPSPNANSDSSTSNAHSGSGVANASAPASAAQACADDRDALVVLDARHRPAGERRAAGRNRRERNQRKPGLAGGQMIDHLVVQRHMHGQSQHRADRAAAGGHAVGHHACRPSAAAAGTARRRGARATRSRAPAPPPRRPLPRSSATARDSGYRPRSAPA